jgi:hypothetical protein
MSSSHWFVFECPAGQFQYSEKLPDGAQMLARFGSRAEAITHAKKYHRDFLSPMTWGDGTPLTVPERVHLGVWRNDMYNELRERSRMRAEGPGSTREPATRLRASNAQ